MQTSGNQGGALSHTNISEDGGTSSHLSDGAARRHSPDPYFLANASYAGTTASVATSPRAVGEEVNEHYAG